MKQFSFSQTSIEGLTVVERQPISDKRGFFTRMFCTDQLNLIGWNQPIAQINHTLTIKKGSIRGMHFQYAPHTEMKLVSCLRGEIWDVAVDLRSNSPTFLHWHGIHLSAKNLKSLFIPEGFAHGFQTLADNVELLYFHSATYSPTTEGGLNPHDPKLQIDWPLSTTEISARDLSHPPIQTNFKGIAP